MPLPQNTFAPKNKTKGLFDKTKALMSKRKPEQSFCYAPTEESGCIFRIRFFNRIPGGNRWWRYRTELMQIPGCICRFALGFCKNIKKRTETLYQSFSPFMVWVRRFELPASWTPCNENWFCVPEKPWFYWALAAYSTSYNATKVAPKLHESSDKNSAL